MTSGMTASTASSEPATTTVSLDRRVLRLWRIRLALVLGPVVVTITVVLGVVAGAAAALATAVVLGGVFASVSWWWTGIAWRAWEFSVGEEALLLRHGVLTRRVSTIPFHRVQHIDTEAGPLERRLGLTTFVLRTASASSDSTVPGIDAADAEALRAQILGRVGSGDAT